MKTTLTITSKGQTTIPVSIRRRLGLDKKGGVLQVNFDEDKGELTISKPLTIDELSSRLTTFIKPGTTPLANVDAYYQANHER